MAPDSRDGSWFCGRCSLGVLLRAVLRGGLLSATAVVVFRGRAAASAVEAVEQVDEGVGGVGNVALVGAAAGLFEHPPFVGLLEQVEVGLVEVAEAQRDDVQKALAFCLNPMVELTTALKPKMTVAYTAYYFKPHLLAFYGALAYVKYATEKLAVENPQQYKCLRIGSFVSKATRGIGLLLQRMSKTAPHLKPLMDQYAKSGMKFSEFFFDYIAKEEKKNIAGDRPYRMTTEDDIVAGHLHLLKGETAPIINVLGDQIWTDNTLPALPAEMAKADALLA